MNAIYGEVSVKLPVQAYPIRNMTNIYYRLVKKNVYKENLIVEKYDKENFKLE